MFVLGGEDIEDGEDRCCCDPYTCMGEVTTWAYPVIFVKEWRVVCIRKAQSEYYGGSVLPSAETECKVGVWFAISFWFGQESLGVEGCWVVVYFFVHRDTPTRMFVPVASKISRESWTHPAFAMTVVPSGINIPR